MTGDREHVLVVAPTAVDAKLTRTILSEAHIDCVVCEDLGALASAVREGAGALLVTDHTLAAGDPRALVEALHSQPPWSEIPLVLLSGRGADSDVAAWAMERLGNVTVLERPVRLSTLVSTLRTALRARRRQYQLRDRIETLRHAEASLRRQSERLRLLWEIGAGLLTTDDPKAMIEALFDKIASPFELDAGLSYIVHEESGALQLAASTGVPDEVLPAIAAHPVEACDHPSAQAVVRQLRLRAFACCPMNASGRLLGTLSFGSRRKAAFGADELEFFQTVTHYVTAAYERLSLIDKLRDTDRRKDEFLATLAHELRNPLAPIRSSLHILRMQPGNASAVHRAQAMMERQVQQLVRLIDDLLDVSRITRGKLVLHKERVALADVIGNAVDVATPLAEAAGHRIVTDLPREPVYLDADPVRIAQVFSNLLNNSAKYMNRGGEIRLEARIDGGEVVVVVRDQGIGIPRESLRRIFDMFTQVDRSLEKSQGGLGIGLTLVKRLTELHGGTVEARSEGVGRGAEMIVRLPVSQAPAAAIARPTSAAAASAACKVLVADDNQDAARSLAMLLTLMGHEVRAVEDGLEAVEEAARFRPDVVLLDIGMPRLNGYDAAARIRAEPWGAPMVLVALTGWGQDRDKRQAEAAGFDAHFTKPVDPQELAALLARAAAHGEVGAAAR